MQRSHKQHLVVLGRHVFHGKYVLDMGVKSEGEDRYK